MFDISCIICTHNPRRDYLDRTLESIRVQTLDQDKWELILVDNASEDLLSDSYGLSWHSNGRVVREDRVGLIHARLRSFAETKSPLIVFSDDDNELAPNYLEKAWEKYVSFPQLGAFGACIDCDYEEPIEAPREFIDVFRDPNGGKGTVWSNDPWHGNSSPIGAGLCLRREVATSYLDIVQKDSTRLMLGRTGTQLLSYEDTDIVHHATEMGYGKGIFETLRLTHLISSSRTSKEYLLRLTEGHSYSQVLYLHKKKKIQPRSLKSRLATTLRNLGLRGFAKDLSKASQKGQVRAQRELRKLEDNRNCRDAVPSKSSRK